MLMLLPLPCWARPSAVKPLLHLQIECGWFNSSLALAFVVPSFAHLHAPSPARTCVMNIAKIGSTKTALLIHCLDRLRFHNTKIKRHQYNSAEFEAFSLTKGKVVQCV